MSACVCVCVHQTAMPGRRLALAQPPSVGHSRMSDHCCLTNTSTSHYTTSTHTYTPPHHTPPPLPPPPTPPHPTTPPPHPTTHLHTPLHHLHTPPHTSTRLHT